MTPDSRRSTTSTSDGNKYVGQGALPVGPEARGLNVSVGCGFDRTNSVNWPCMVHHGTLSIIILVERILLQNRVASRSHANSGNRTSEAFEDFEGLHSFCPRTGGIASQSSKHQVLTTGALGL